MHLHSTLRVSDICAPINTPKFVNSQQQTPKLIVYPMSGGGSSGKNYYDFGKGKGGRKGDPIIWEGPLGHDSFPEPVFEFPPQHKSEFTNETPLRQYDNRGQNADMVRTA